MKRILQAIVILVVFAGAQECNIGYGFKSLWNLMSGSFNFCSGYTSCPNLTAGDNNFCYGDYSCLWVTTQSNLTCIGDFACSVPMALPDGYTKYVWKGWDRIAWTWTHGRYGWCDSMWKAKEARMGAERTKGARAFTRQELEAFTNRNGTENVVLGIHAMESIGQPSANYYIGKSDTCNVIMGAEASVNDLTVLPITINFGRNPNDGKRQGTGFPSLARDSCFSWLCHRCCGNDFADKDFILWRLGRMMDAIQEPIKFIGIFVLAGIWTAALCIGVSMTSFIFHRKTILTGFFGLLILSALFVATRFFFF